jgi:hypothetical protein
MSADRRLTVAALVGVGVLAALTVVAVWAVREVMERAERNLADLDIEEMVERWFGSALDDDGWAAA